MRNTVAVVLIIIGIVLLGSKIATGGFLNTKSVHDEKIVDVADVQIVKVQTGSINVKAVPGTADEAVIRLVGKSSGSIALDAEIKGDVLIVTAKHEFKWSPINIGINNAELIVELPERKWNTIQVISSSGNNYVKGLHSELVTVEASSGNIFMGDINAANASVELKSGNIKIEGFDINELSVKAGSGNITLDNGRGSVNAESVSGNIVADMDEITDSIRLQGRSGNVILKSDTLPSNADVVLETRSGNHKIEWPGMTTVSSSEKMFTGRIGDGGIKIELETRSGNVKLQN